MDAEAWVLFSTSIRTVLITIGNVGTSVFFAYILLGKRRSFGPLILYYVFKTLVSIVLISRFLQHYYGETQWFQILSVASVWIFVVLSCAVNYYTFKGELLKVFIGFMIGEMISVFLGYFSIAFINLLEGKEDIWIFFDELQIMDIGTPMLVFLLALSVYHFTAGYLYKFRTYELKHKKLLWAVFVCHATLGSVTMIISYNTMVVAGALGVLVSCAAGFGVCYLIVTYRRRLKNRQKHLLMQQKIMEAHYEAVQRQICAMEKSQEKIDNQMQEILALQDSTAESEWLVSYLSNLKQNYESIQAGIYGDDWMVDAVLHSQAAVLKKQGIRFECSMQESNIGRIEEQDFIQILILLLNFAMDANLEPEAGEEKSVCLSTAAVKNQLLVEFSTTGGKRARISKRKFKEYLKKYQGTFEVEKDDKRVRCILRMQRG